MAKETYQVITDQRVRLKIVDIVNYLSEHASIETAEKVSAGIFKIIRELNYMPTRHKIYHSVSEKALIYRRALIWSYVIVFYINEIDMTVRVVDIIHSKQDTHKS